MSASELPDLSVIRGPYPDRAARMAFPDELHGSFPHYGGTVDGRAAWAM